MLIMISQNKKKDPAYGADVLRMWAATVEYGSDSPIGPAVLAQCAESLRKVRNSARFILGNIKDKASRRDFQSVPREEMQLVSSQSLLVDDC
jgi:isoleucyl-tRNA synthetase